MPVNEPNQGVPQDAIQAAFHQGRQTGLAMGALALSIVAFVSLLGLEKAILAAVLGLISIRGLAPGSPGRRYGTAAIAITIVYAVTFAIVLGVFHDRIAELARLLQQLG